MSKYPGIDSRLRTIPQADDPAADRWSDCHNQRRDDFDDADRAHEGVK
jgi:hypothetical protein